MSNSNALAPGNFYARRKLHLTVHRTRIPGEGCTEFNVEGEFIGDPYLLMGKEEEVELLTVPAGCWVQTCEGCAKCA
jgi:hypothetical protein